MVEAIKKQLDLLHVRSQEELYSMRDQIKILRQTLGRLVCTPEKSNQVLPHGGWCLAPDKNSNVSIFPGVPLAQHHVIADPPLAKALAGFFSGFTVVDLGAGIGQYESAWASMKADVDVIPYDGALNVEEYTQGRVRWADFTQPLWIPESPFDWVISLEVGEHIPADYQKIYMDNLDKHNLCGVVLSWAVPGQGGHSHVNELQGETVQREMDRRGYDYDQQTSIEWRGLSTYYWFKKTIMIFHRRNAPSRCHRAIRG